MKSHLDKIGAWGALLAAAACPVCFPKLALLGAIFGLGAFSAYELQFLIAAQILVALAVVGHVLAFRRHRRPWLLGAAIVSAAAVFSGLYLLGSEALSYAGFAGLVLTSATDFWNAAVNRLFRAPETSQAANTKMPRAGR